MKRIRKCCCGCKPGDSKIIATSPNASGMWDITSYQSKTFRKYGGKYWDVLRGTNILAVGRINDGGKLESLPSSVTLTGGQAELRIRCHPIFSDQTVVAAVACPVDGSWTLEYYPPTNSSGVFVWTGEIDLSPVTNYLERHAVYDSYYTILGSDEKYFVAHCDWYAVGVCNEPFEALNGGSCDFENLTTARPYHGTTLPGVYCRCLYTSPSFPSYARNLWTTAMGQMEFSTLQDFVVGQPLSSAKTIEYDIENLDAMFNFCVFPTGYSVKELEDMTLKNPKQMYVFVRYFPL